MTTMAALILYVWNTDIGRYDPYRLVIWEDEAQTIISDYEELT